MPPRVSPPVDGTSLHFKVLREAGFAGFSETDAGLAWRPFPIVPSSSALAEPNQIPPSVPRRTNPAPQP